MILTKQVEIIGNSRNIKYYNNKGIFIQRGEKKIIDIFDLSDGSSFEVEVMCDFCNSIKFIQWGILLKYINNNIDKKYYCSKCNSIKRNSTNQLKYGGKSPLCDKNILNKVKNTNITKYGNNSTLHGSNQENIENILLEKYGTKTPSKLTYIKEKTKNTNLKKYGGVAPLCNITVLERKIETNLKKYGVLDIQKNNGYRKENYKLAKNINYIEYIDNGISLFKCDLNKDHNFEMHKDNYYNRININTPLCTICYPISEQKSIKENELLNFIKSNYDGSVISGYRDNLEIDIYLPSLNLGFEFNGLYWHSENFKEKNYHLNKSLFFRKKGIRIIHIWEDDWIHKNEIILSQIKNHLILTENKLFARKCYIKEIDNCKDFLEKNHIQGNINSVIKLGLYYNNELVSLMTFDNFEGRKKMEERGWNLSRFCNKINYNIIGGASKLLTYFIKSYNPKRIISYADMEISQGNLYNILGFAKISESKPDYKYIINNKRIHKSNFKKSILIKNGNDVLLTEKEIMLNLGYQRIYDCGKIKYEKII